MFITVRDISKLGEVLDKIVSLGANSIGGISFGVANREAWRTRRGSSPWRTPSPRRSSSRKPRAPSSAPVMTISEQGGFQPYFEKRAAAPMAAQAPVPIEAGTESVSMQVSVTWELK